MNRGSRELSPADGKPPRGGGRPPAPPATGGPERGAPDPFDHGPPIVVSIDGKPFGDLGSQAIDEQLLSAVLQSWSEVAEWLVGFGAVATTPPDPQLLFGWLSLDQLAIGQIGRRHADARLAWAITARSGPLGVVTYEHVEAAFPGAAWL